MGVAEVTLNKRWPHRKWTDEDGEKYSGWRRFMMDDYSLFTAVVLQGWAFAPVHNPTDLICTKSFQRSHYLVADIDEECDAMDLLDKHNRTPLPLFVYSTPSHTDEAPRCRAVYRLPRSIQKDEYIKAQKGLFQLLRADGVSADLSCWNPARWFFGGKCDAPHCFLGTDTWASVLTEDDFQNIRENAPPEPQASSVTFTGPRRNTNKSARIWVQHWLEDLGNGRSITPRDSRHSLMLWVAFQMKGQATDDLIERVLVELIDFMVPVNGERAITEKEIRDIISYPG